MRKKTGCFFKGRLKTILLMLVGVVVLFLVVEIEERLFSRIHRDATLLNKYNHKIHRGSYDPWNPYLIYDELILYFARYKNYGIIQTKNNYLVLGPNTRSHTTNKNVFLNNPVVISALKSKVILNTSFRHFVEHTYRNIFFRFFNEGKKYYNKYRISLIPIPHKIKQPYMNYPYNVYKKNAHPIVHNVLSYASDKGYIYGTYKVKTSIRYFILACNTLKVYKFNNKKLFGEKLYQLKLSVEKIVGYSLIIHERFLNKYSWIFSTGDPLHRGSWLAHWVLSYINNGGYEDLAYDITHLNYEKNKYYGKCRAGWFILDIKKGEYLFYWDKKKFNEELVKLNFSISLNAVNVTALNTWNTPPGESLKLHHR